MNPKQKHRVVGCSHSIAGFLGLAYMNRNENGLLHITPFPFFLHSRSISGAHDWSNFYVGLHYNFVSQLLEISGALYGIFPVVCDTTTRLTTFEGLGKKGYLWFSESSVSSLRSRVQLWISSSSFFSSWISSATSFVRPWRCASMPPSSDRLQPLQIHRRKTPFPAFVKPDPMLQDRGRSSSETFPPRPAHSKFTNHGFQKNHLFIMTTQFETALEKEKSNISKHCQKSCF